ncbi:hypothetical protein BU24DRAFT_463592 [Aaosphaeria arxii CBS 175.79]|uniref:Uncharacterized protein n=1 Tax=Aaosphaeria arxii CBS 175.79 TaxID=1450172 RepID=A0A6A5XNN1_9PLEO|nr:uncharacterized protein BU24DRAFT_463592 [Aaosphaeria arxii CBS 175.79]KAF2014848.1 hypothetical protein BU24DRAFT_463592 [Aaosphaeria arxii CBS 175.79]
MVPDVAVGWSSDCSFRLRIALAVAVLETKPDDTTPREYILRLRAHLKVARGNAVGVRRQRFFDCIAYWKDRCEILDARVANLEKRMEVMQDNNRPTGLLSNSSVDGAPSSQTGQVQRKQKVLPRSQSMTSSKGDTTRSFAGPPENMESYHVDGDRPQSPAHDHSFAEILTESVSRLHRLRKQHSEDPETICLQLIHIVRSIGTCQISTPHTRPASSNGNEDMVPEASHIQTVVACSRAFNMVLTAFRKVRSALDKTLLASVVYECLRMYRSLLDQIAEKAKRLGMAEVAGQTGRVGQSGAKPLRDSGSLPNPTSHFLYNLLSSLDKNDTVEREIFEGWLFLVVKRVGDLLFFSTFGAQRARLIETDIVRWESTSRNARNTTQDVKVERLAFQTEVRPLVTLLKRAMALAPLYMNPRSAASTRNVSNQARSAGSRPSVSSTSRTPLYPRVRERLQRTLIHCMFGEGDDNELLDILRKPARPGRYPKDSIPTNTGVEDWFMEEVWKVVGWDLLSREGGEC